jgi:hypothetical protein
MQARCFCPEHGKQDFDGIVIKNGTPMCMKCMKPLEFGKVQPRPVVSAVPKKEVAVKKAAPRKTATKVAASRKKR